MIKQIKFVSVPVADQDRALDFYTEKLGFTIITDQPFDEKQRWIELRVPKAETRVVLFTPEGDEKRIGSFMNISYAVFCLKKKRNRLQTRPRHHTRRVSPVPVPTTLHRINTTIH